MKKMMMMIAAIAVSATVQAATVNWASTTSGLVTQGGSGLAGVTVTLIQLGIEGIDFTNFTGLNTAPATGAEPTWNGSAWVASGSTVIGTATTAADGSFGGSNSFSFQSVLGTIPLNEANTWFALVATGPGGIYGASSPMKLSDYNSVVSIGNLYLGDNIEMVPEPTSMALLALGIAAVGLRRKVRK